MHDVVGGHELEASGDVGAELAVGEVHEQAAHARRLEVRRAEDGAGGGDHHVEAAGDGLEALVLHPRFGALVGHVLFRRVEGVALVGRATLGVADGAEGARHHHPLDVGGERGGEEVLRADHVAVVDLALSARGRRDLGRAVVDAVDTAHRPRHVAFVAEIAGDALDGQAVESAVVAPGRSSAMTRSPS